MDFQNAIVGMVPEEQRSALIERVARVLPAMRAAGGTVGHVRVAFTPDDAAAVPSANKMFSGMPLDRMSADGPETTIVDDLTPEPDDVVVRKTRVGALSTTDLHEQLQRRGITTLVLTGIATSGVVLSTVRDAADRDYRLLVLSDGCADSDPRAHDVLVDQVFQRQADVLSIADFQRALGG